MDVAAQNDDPIKLRNNRPSTFNNLDGWDMYDL